MTKLLFCLAAAMAMVGCAKETPQSQSAEDEAIARARAFVEAQNPSVQTRGVNKNHPAIEAFEADWSRARVHKFKEQKLTVTEVPTTLASPYIYTVLVERLGERVSLTRQEPHTRILVYEQHGKDKSMSVMLATLLADEDWAGDLAELTPRPVNSDFSGVTMYSTADGILFLGERWDEGVSTHDLFFDDKNHGPAAEDLRIQIGVNESVLTRWLGDFWYDIDGDGKIDDGEVGKMIESVTVEERRIVPENGGGGGVIMVPPVHLLPGWSYGSSGASGDDSQGGGDDGGDAEAPATEPTDPCANMQTKMNEPEFVAMLDAIKNLTSSNYEAGRAYTYSSGNYIFTAHDGNPGEPWIDISLSQQADGFIHSHYDGGTWPIFSSDDLLAPGALNAVGKVKDLGSFSFGLVTSSGTYFLQITNQAEYLNFYNSFKDFVGVLTSYLQNSGVGIGSSPTGAADSLAKLLKATNSGLTLLKKNGNNFDRLDVARNGNGVLIYRCPNK